MVICVVVGCSKWSDRDTGVSFYRLPVVIRDKGERELELSSRRRDGYLAAISREDLDVDNLHKYRICSRHFNSGPAKLYDCTNPDWLPTLHLGHSKLENKQPCSERYERAQRREKQERDKQHFRERFSDTILEESIKAAVDEAVLDIVEQLILTKEVLSNCIDEVISEVIDADVYQAAREEVEVEIWRRSEGSCKCQSEVQALREELSKCYAKINELTMKVQQLSLPPFSEETLNSDEKVLFYTGLPNFKVLKAIYDHVVSTLPVDGYCSLTLFQQFMCTILKLRLNDPIQHLAFQFNVSKATVSRILLKWLTQMDIMLQDLIIWPDRDSLRKTMPQCFQESFGKTVAVIIDCFEVFIERPSNLRARASTWSNYKHRNTAKLLIGIIPQGTVAFISESWGGRVSDKHLTEHCGILKKLLPGDVVLADRGFDIADSVASMRAKLYIPAFTRGKPQLSAMEVEETRRIANVRIHVERVIGLVRQKYPIVRSTIPIHYLTTKATEDVPLFDRIVRVCCALSNVCDSVVPFE